MRTKPWYLHYKAGQDCWKVGTHPERRGNRDYVEICHAHPENFNHPNRELKQSKDDRKRNIQLIRYAPVMKDILERVFPYVTNIVIQDEIYHLLFVLLEAKLDENEYEMNK